MFLQSLFKMGTPDPLRRALEHLDAGEPRAALALLEVASASDEPAIADTGRLYAAEVLLQLGEESLFEDPEGARAFFARAAEHQPPCRAFATPRRLGGGRARRRAPA